MGDVEGTEEKTSIRAVWLRRHLGPLHTMPSGKIKALTNHSRDRVIMKLPLRVACDTDVDTVRRLVKPLGEDRLRGPVIGDRFRAPPLSQGAIARQGSAMIARVRFMARLGEHWLIRQRVYQDIRALFRREGINVAPREVTLRVGEPGATRNRRPRRPARGG